jgi:hypothetical protein
MNSLSRTERALFFFILAAATMLPLVGCGADGGGLVFAGSIDTLPDGRVVVSNPATGMWGEGEAWEVTEEIRIGRVDGDGPDMFGSVGLLEVDVAGRFYVFERQAQELRVFDTDGSHVRTVGRKGGGPGEFNQVIGMDWSPDGNLWMVDPQNNRISVFDTAGAYVKGHRTIGGYVISPWPGGFDDQGRFYNYGVDPDAEGFGMVLVRFDENLEPVDTIAIPRWDGEENFFELRSERGWMRAGVPYSPSISWQFVRRTPYMWIARTGDYQIYQQTMDGDTVRAISRAFDPLPVTGEDLDSAIAGLEWFVSQGGKIEHSKFPSVKPALRRFYVDDVGRLYVIPVTTEERNGRVLDVFDVEGRYLGRLDLPFKLSSYPRAVIRGGMMYAVTIDEFDVPFVVRARLGSPSTVERGRARELVGGG